MKLRIYKHEMRQLDSQRFSVRLIDFVSLHEQKILLIVKINDFDAIEIVKKTIFVEIFLYLFIIIDIIFDLHIIFRQQNLCVDFTKFINDEISNIKK